MNCYFLQRDTYLSLTRNAGVLLDLRRGEYLGLSQAQVHALADAVQGWPATSRPASEARPDEQAVTDLLARLVDRGLLTKDESRGKHAALTTLQSADAELAECESLKPPQGAYRHLWNLVLAYARARASFRLRSTASILQSVRARKARYAATQVEPDVAELQRLVNVFGYLRTFVYTSHEKCLLDSFVLVEFLARYKIFPAWVLGVTTDPFSAHSWVQYRQYVLNDRVPKIRCFYPILAV